jgi:hypothetical protein
VSAAHPEANMLRRWLLHITPLLILDSCRCHTKPAVVSEIEALTYEIQIIPGGCTGLCQSIDVEIGKPLSRARHLWVEWMVQECTANNAASSCPPSRLLTSQWITVSVHRIIASPSMTRNSWRHAKYSYFPNETVAAVETAEPPGAARAVHQFVFSLQWYCYLLNKE